MSLNRINHKNVDAKIEQEIGPIDVSIEEENKMNDPEWFS